MVRLVLGTGMAGFGAWHNIQQEQTTWSSTTTATRQTKRPQRVRDAESVL
jgi:hypothetical protein